MHPYSTDNDRGRYAYLGSAVVSILAAYLLGVAVKQFQISPPWWLDTPAVLGFYGLIWKLYDKALWRIPIGRSNVAGILNLRGTWVGRIESDYNGGITVSARIEIAQTASRIQVCLITETSRSESAMAAARATGAFAGLHYNYFNEPRPLAATSMGAHRGTAHLQLTTDGALEGEYRNDGRRATSGRLYFTRA